MFKNARNFYGINGVQGGLREWQIETTVEPLSEVISKNGNNILDGANLYKACPHAKAGEVFHGQIADKDMSCLRPTGCSYTCIADGGAFGIAKYAYAIAHKNNEHVKIINVDTLGRLSRLAENPIRFNQLVRMKRIGIVTLNALGGGGEQSFDVKDGSNTMSINRVNIDDAGQLAFANNAPAGTFSEIACDYISDRVCLKYHGDDPNEDNTGKAVVYIVYDSETDVTIDVPLRAINATGASFAILPQVYGVLNSVRKIIYVTGNLNGDNRWVINKGNTAATASTNIFDNWDVINGAKIFQGETISVVQTVADSNNVSAALRVTLHFVPA